DYNLPVATNNETTLVKDNFSVLPLQLLTFTGHLTNSDIQLHWDVSNATNFQRFEVERSVDGRTYNRTAALPFNTSISSYNAIDNISNLFVNTVFYRLKLIDADGQHSYSKVVVFKISSPGDKLFVYPNPARTELYVSFAAAGPGNLQVKILDAAGRLLIDKQNQIQKGNNVFPVSVSPLKAGNYILQLSNNGQTKASKFTIMN
ncbi:MAG: T9SS type A sorting domain-containing protein, partial [Flavisolibacter sp.]